MARLEKHVTVRGRDVVVTSWPATEGHHLTLRAECDGEVCEHSMTIGPAEGAGPEHYDQAMLQRDLDAARQKVAAEVEWHARLRTLMEGVS